MASIKRYKTAKGTAWRVQYRSPDGRSRTKQGFRTKDQATAWADKNATKVREGDWIDPTKTLTPISDLWAPWINAQTHLSESSTRALTASWETHVKPQWGTTPLSAITYPAVQAWVSDLSGKRSASIVHRAFHLFRSLIRMAMLSGMTKHDPTAGVRLPSRKSGKITTLTASQVVTLAETSKRYKSLILFLGFTGARWGEATALTVGDVDVKRGRAIISKSVTGSTKTKQTRSIAVPEHVLEAMKPDMANKLPKALIWTRDGANPVPTPSRRSWWHAAVDKCMAADPNFPEVTPHDLRHAAASILISSGASVLVVQRQLGHASAKMTLDKYAHLFDADLDEVNDVMANVVEMSWDSAK